RLLSVGFHPFSRASFGRHLGSGAFYGGQSSTAGPATHLDVIVPETVTSGNSFDVLVKAEDASNHLATGYTGTVHFSLGTADTVTSSISGQGTTTVDAPGAITHFAVYTLGRALAGSPTQVEVVALDASNNLVTGYTGTVHFTSSDSQATLPADYTFTASDNG